MKVAARKAQHVGTSCTKNSGKCVEGGSNVIDSVERGKLLGNKYGDIAGYTLAAVEAFVMFGFPHLLACMLVCTCGTNYLSSHHNVLLWKCRHWASFCVLEMTAANRCKAKQLVRTLAFHKAVKIAGVLPSNA